MQQTGAAELLATELTDAVGDSSTWVLLAGLFLLTAVLGQLISNTATALIVIPIARVRRRRSWTRRRGWCSWPSTWRRPRRSSPRWPRRPTSW